MVPPIVDTAYRDSISNEAAFWDEHYINTKYSSFAHDVDYIREHVTHKNLHKIAGLIRPGDCVLDYGCGSGWLSFLLSPSKAAITGIDIAAGCIDEANRKATASFGNCVFMREDLNFLTLPGNHYNAVISFGALHHLVRLDFAMDQIFQSLKADGFLMVYECVDRLGVRGKIADLLADVCHMILPTDLSYSDKLRHAWRKLAGKKPSIQPLSPLEGVGSGNWLKELTRRFDIVYLEEYYGFITPFIGRMKPRILGLDMVRVMFHIDRWLVKIKLLQPEMYFLIAKRKPTNGDPRSNS